MNNIATPLRIMSSTRLVVRDGFQVEIHHIPPRESIIQGVFAGMLPHEWLVLLKVVTERHISEGRLLYITQGWIYADGLLKVGDQVLLEIEDLLTIHGAASLFAEVVSIIKDELKDG